MLLQVMPFICVLPTHSCSSSRVTTWAICLVMKVQEACCLYWEQKVGVTVSWVELEQVHVDLAFSVSMSTLQKKGLSMWMMLWSLYFRCVDMFFLWLYSYTWEVC